MRARILLAALAASPLLIAQVHAAESLDDLLKQVQNLRAEENRINAAREADFKRDRDQQAKLMQDAVAARNQAEATSASLSAQYDANELRIGELQGLLHQREGNLGELFGVTRQVAGDAANTLEGSLIGAQYPPKEGEEDRVAFMRRLAGAKALPSIRELERLWLELQREMTESGKVVAFNSKVVQPGGEKVDTKVIRVGGFTASSEDEYLGYIPSEHALQVLPRQPGGKLTGIAEDLADSTGQSEYVRAVADPARGVLLAMYVERPSWVERIQRGESINYVILAVGFAGLIIAIYQTLFLFRERIAVRRQLANLDHPSNDNSLGRVLLAFKGDPHRIEEDAEVAELRVSEATMKEIPVLERFQSFLRLAVAAGPLLGLIGTVIGMIITFQSITESGQSDPKLMAGGIGTAMIATVLGLGIAIPLLFLNAFLTSMSRSVVQVLDEQSYGLLAESIEKKRG